MGVQYRVMSRFSAPASRLIACGFFVARDAVEQGAGAERDQIEQCHAGILFGQPRQQVAPFFG